MTFICNGKPKNSCDLLKCNFTLLPWSGTELVILASFLLLFRGTLALGIPWYQLCLYTARLIFVYYLAGMFCTYLELSLHATFFPPVFFPAISSHFSFYKHLALSPQLREKAATCLNFSSYAASGKLPPGRKLEQL